MKNHQRALEYYVKATRGGSTKAMVKLASIYSEDRFEISKYPNANPSFVCVRLDVSENQGENIKEVLNQRYKIACTYLTQAAKFGDAEAMYKLSRLYEKPSLLHDAEKCEKWRKEAFEKCCNSNDIEAMVYLADYLYYDRSTDIKSKKKAVKIFDKCARAGNVIAMQILGNVYSEDEEFIDYAKACDWYLKCGMGAIGARLVMDGKIYDKLSIPERLNKVISLLENTEDPGGCELMILAHYYLQRNKGEDFNKSMNLFDKALSMWGTTAYLGMGRTLKDNGFLKEAIIAFKKYLSSNIAYEETVQKEIGWCEDHMHS